MVQDRREYTIADLPVCVAARWVDSHKHCRELLKQCPGVSRGSSELFQILRLAYSLFHQGVCNISSMFAYLSIISPLRQLSIMLSREARSWMRIGGWCSTCQRIERSWAVVMEREFGKKGESHR